MRSFKRDNLTPTAKQPQQKQVYSPSRTATYQNPNIPLQPPPTIPSTMNKNRTQQIVLLHEQFEDLKRKIKQVQNNNQKIIQKIHRECNFKKKTPQQVFDSNVTNVDTKPIVYYEKKEKKASQLSQHSGMSIDESNKSDQSEFEFRQKRKPSTRGLSNQNTNYMPSKTFTQSMQYNRIQQPPLKQANKSLLNKKSSKLSQHQTSKYHQPQANDESLENIDTSQQLAQDDFDQQQGVDMMNIQYQHSRMMQHSMQQQGYDYLGEFNGGGNGSSTGKSSSGKKSAGFTTNYPLSQQHMLTHSGFGININPSPQETRTPTLNTQQPPRASNSSSTSSKQQFTIYQLQQSLKIQKQKITYLQQELKSKQLQILNIKKDYNRLTTQLDSVEMIVEDNLECFLENVIKKRFFEMEKAIKKNQNRLRNMAINVKDSYQEVKSNKIIREHQLLRRSNSRSKRDMSPRNTSFQLSSCNNPLAQSTLTPPPSQPQAKIPRPSSSYANGFYQQQPPTITPPSLSTLPPSNPVDKRSRVSQQSKKNKQFEQIVHKYQQMIKSKRQQISKLQQSKSLLQKSNQKLQNQLQTKQTQVRQIKQKLDQLEKLMSQTYNELPIIRIKPSPAPSVIKSVASRPISSVESNLLEDIEHEFDNDMIPEIVKMEQMHAELKQELMAKNEKISSLQQLIRNYETNTAVYQSNVRSFQQRTKAYQQTITKLQSTLSQTNNNYKADSMKLSASITLLDNKLARQKIQLEIKSQLAQTHKKQITLKEQQIIQVRNAQITLQKKLVEKDCQVLSLTNKVKKLQGTSDILQTKVQQYQKLLNQHNTSVDLMNDSQFMSLLDRSVCNQNYSPSHIQSARRNTTTSSGNQKKIAVSYEQLQSMQCQVKESLEQILQLTKRVKSLQRVNQQQLVEIDKLQQENQLLQKEKHTLTKQINELKDQVKQLQQKIEDMNDEDSEIDHGGRIDWGIDQRKSADYQHNSNNINRHSQIRLSTMQHNTSPLLLQSTKQQDPMTHMQQTIHRLQDQLLIVKSKNIQLSAQYNTLKQQILQAQRSNITIQKDNQYLEQTLSDRQQKYQRVKRQYEQLKIRNNQLQQLYTQKQQQLRRQKDDNCAKIQQLQKQWHEFEQQINNNNNPDNNLYDSIHPQNKDMQRSQLLKSSRYNVSQSSILLSSTIHNKNSQYLQQQNQYLTIKLKQAQATIQMHNMMQQKVVNQYKSNVQRLRAQMKQRNKQCESLRKELQMVNDAKRRIQIMYESSRNYLAQSRSNQSQIRSRQLSQVSNTKSKSQLTRQHKANQQNTMNEQQHQVVEHNLQMQQFPSYCEDHNNMSLLSGADSSPFQHPTDLINQQSRLYPYQRIIQLQGQLKQAKDINKKLQQMQQQLFKQIKLKQQQKKDMLKLIDEKNVQIQQLEEIVELKEQNQSHANILNSHLSSNYKHSSQSRNNLSQRQSLHSHSSLRYSGITHSRFPNQPQPQPHYQQQVSINTLQVMGASQMGQSQRFQIQLSQTGSQMLDKSYVTNISQIFQKQQFPYQKVQLKRKQQIKLFEKTASYIKSLKDSISEKNKRIKLLQKKIQSLKSNHQGQLLPKQLQSKYQISTKAAANNSNNNSIDNYDDLEIQFESVFKDYQSVQLQRKKASHNKRYKTLEHEWKLAIEENNVLVNQVQVLQQQLEKAQQQQNSILVMKDLYKEEIKKLLAKNQSQIAYYEDLLGKQRKKVQQSQSVHNLQTIKQLFMKVMDAIIIMESEKSKRKREEKRKQLEQLFAIFASLCAVDEGKRQAIVEGLKRMTLNIVLADQGRNSSKIKE